MARTLSHAACALVVFAASCATSGEPPEAADTTESGRARGGAGKHEANTGRETRPGDPRSTPSADPAREFTVVLSGDVLLHDGLWHSARRDAARAGGRGLEFRPLLAGMRQVIDGADLAVCHLETPLGRRRGPFSNYPIFNAPPQITPALAWAGFDACTTASNHSVDQGMAGVRRTLHTLDRNGLAHAGTARTPAEARRPTLVGAGTAGDPVRVGLVSQTYGVNGMPVEKPWSVQRIDGTDILRRARAAREAGADVVLVALHWGQEYQREPTATQRRLARKLLRSPAVDLLYGHHAHVVQPFDKVHGKWAAFGLGNMVAQQETEATGVYEGVTARFTFRERRDGRFAVRAAEYVPTYITEYEPAAPRMRLLRTTRALEADRAEPGRRALKASLRRVTRAANMLGAGSHGLTLAR